MRSLTLGLGVGIVAGAVVAASAIHSMYPDVHKRMMRDGKRAFRTTKRAIGHFMG